MKTSIKHVLVYLMIAAAIACGVTGTSFAGGEEEAIDKVRLAFNAAYNAGNASAMAELIDHDAVWMPPTGEQAIVGAQKVGARYTAFFKKTKSAFELQPGKIQVCDQWAFMDGSWHRTDSTLRGGKGNKAHGGYYLMVFKKQSDGNWKIARDIWNDAGKSFR